MLLGKRGSLRLLTHWDWRMMAMAKLVATWSKDPSTKVGAVIADREHRVVSVGYNGYPMWMPDTAVTDPRNIRLGKTIHAEVNAILNAGRPIPVGSTLYTTFPPCDRCMVQIIQTGVHTVITLPPVVPRLEWMDSFLLARQCAKECDVDYVVMEEA